MPATRLFVPPPATLSIALALIAAGCGGDGGGPEHEEALTDADGDGLADSYEEEIGTDPGAEDTDGDGYTDLDEVEGFSDPADETSHPYLGGWARMPVPEDLAEEETGHEVGDLAADFTLMDQYGEQVRLWSFYGNVILLDSGAFW